MKERKEEELEKHSFNAEIIEDPSIGVNMVKFFILKIISIKANEKSQIDAFLRPLDFSDYLSK